MLHPINSTAYVAAVRLEAALTRRQAGETIASAARRSGMGSERSLRRAMTNQHHNA